MKTPKNPLRNLSFLTLLLLLLPLRGMAQQVVQDGRGVTVRPDDGAACVISLQPVADHIIRVRATSKTDLPEKPKSLIIVPQTQPVKFQTTDDASAVTVSTARVQAKVDKRTGRLTFFDGQGRQLLGESRDGKQFHNFTVPAREIGTDSASVAMAHRQGLSWQTAFDLQPGEGLYGLGQHQSEELNMRGKNEDLFQYNTKVSVPFVVSSRGYGLLWDSYSYCRFGQLTDYLQLNRAFRLYDKDGREGHLTGTYTDRDGRTTVRQEDSLYFEYNLPASQLANDAGGIKNLPKGLSLDGASVVYEGFIEPASPLLAGEGGGKPYQFILYYAGYVRVYIDGQLVVPERWRTAWNPNTYKFETTLPASRRAQLRVEWQPDGGESYLGLRAAPKQTSDQLTLWSEMAQDMDYYFIAGESMDDVIGGYRTLTGRAPVLPKWAMGYWQSRERYKTQDEVLGTLAEFRRRHLPIDNIVQDWNYWTENQWGSHQFEAARYPDPQAMLDSVHQMHGRFMLSVWPKFYVNTDHYKALDAEGWMYHQAVVDDIHDWVGPGYVGSFYDAYSTGARQMFWEQLQSASQGSSLGKGVATSSVDAWWMDASEPNVRDCTPMWYRKALCGPTALGTSTEYFNAYALVNAQAIYEGLRSINAPSPRKRQGETTARVFQLTRSGFAGLQRYGAATWSGDIGTRWEDMRAQMTAGMNYSMSGLPFWGMDIGGFCVEQRYVKAQMFFDRTQQENDDLKEWRELQARWLQFGAFVPLFRAHGQWPLREPWNIAPDDHPAYRSFVYYDQLRYRLMPYLYSMAGWVHLNHYTMMRALVMDFGADPCVYDIKDQWMFGPSLMACPVSEYKARSRTVYFPAGRNWYDLYSGRCIGGGQRLVVDAPYERIPVFVPEGSILPVGPAMEWSDEKPAELMHIYIYGGRDARFTLYEDEGTNYNYEQGRYATIDISYDHASRTVTFGKRSGSFKGMLKQRQFQVVLIDEAHPQPFEPDSAHGTVVSYDGRQQSVVMADAD